MSDILEPSISITEDQEKEKYTVTTDKGPVAGSEEVDVDEGSVSDQDSTKVLTTAEDFITTVISLEDDPSLRAWTFRSVFLGLGLSAFGAVLAEIYYFKPQTVAVSTMFIAAISYVLGEGLAKVIPRTGVIGRFLNPHSFNVKEHGVIVVMASSAGVSALGTEILAVQRLYYNENPNAGVSIFMLLATQLLGYGIAGLLRNVLVYPTKFYYPANLPLVTMLQNLHGDKAKTAKRLKLFYIAFSLIFIWELIPEWIMPITTGFSIFCLANQHSTVFTYLFGGSSGNEGLGFLSLCLDWNYVGSSGGQGPLWAPIRTISNAFVGYIGCIVLFMACFYSNVWGTNNLPFLSQELFYPNGTEYNQLAVLDANNRVNDTMVKELGVPVMATNYAVFNIAYAMGITASIMHMLLWYWGDMKGAFTFLTPRFWRNVNWRFWRTADSRADPQYEENDPHYIAMLKYKDAPNWWYGCVLGLSFAIGLGLLYRGDSTLPWWGFIVTILLAVVSVLFFTSMYAITGASFISQSLVQMIGGFMLPGLPMANLYFTLYGYNSYVQAQLMAKDLKFGQYIKLAPRSLFSAQVIGTCLGAVLNYIMMNSIVKNQKTILLSVEGTNIWSGQNVQQYNTNAVAWGGFSNYMFMAGQKYQMIPIAYLLGFVAPVPFWLAHKKWPGLKLDTVNAAIICFYIGWLYVGINASQSTWFAVAFISQFYLRKYHPSWFNKYNYLLSAALDGGTQVMVFILTFAVSGGAGTAHYFPQWWGNNRAGNMDHCMYAAT